MVLQILSKVKEIKNTPTLTPILGPFQATRTPGDRLIEMPRGPPYTKISGIMKNKQMAIRHPYDQSVNITHNEVENIQNRK